MPDCWVGHAIIYANDAHRRARGTGLRRTSEKKQQIDIHKEKCVPTFLNKSAALHEDGRDGVLDVAVGGAPKQLPEAALRQLHGTLLLLLRRRAAGRRKGASEGRRGGVAAGSQ